MLRQAAHAERRHVGHDARFLVLRKNPKHCADQVSRWCPCRGVPVALDSLQELAVVLGNSDQFALTLSTRLPNKASMTSSIVLSGSSNTFLGSPRRRERGFTAARAEEAAAAVVGLHKGRLDGTNLELGAVRGAHLPPVRSWTTGTA